MQTGQRRQPIHLHIATRGKIHKFSRELVTHHEPEIQSLVIASKFPLGQKNSPFKMKQNYFFKKHQHIQRPKNHNNEIPHEMDSGSFRAIHTACPFDALKGFPLRSNTPIKPFRRGIRSSNIPLNKHLLLQDIQTERPNTKYNRGSHHSAEIRPFTLQNMAVFQSPQYVPKYNDIENFEQFYMYKGSGLQQSSKTYEENPKIAGTKIEPFKKYKIREIMYKKSQPRHLNYQNQAAK